LFGSSSHFCAAVAAAARALQQRRAVWVHVLTLVTSSDAVASATAVLDTSVAAVRLEPIKLSSACCGIDGSAYSWVPVAMDPVLIPAYLPPNCTCHHQCPSRPPTTQTAPSPQRAEGGSRSCAAAAVFQKCAWCLTSRDAAAAQSQNTSCTVRCYTRMRMFRSCM
jgi:hypothetical protein